MEATLKLKTEEAHEAVVGRTRICRFETRTAWRLDLFPLLGCVVAFGSGWRHGEETTFCPGFCPCCEIAS